jgi:hypothetical protein
MKTAKQSKKELSATERENLLKILKIRFEKNVDRHKGIEWESLQKHLEAHSAKLWSLNEMEKTGGEPDVVNYNTKGGYYVFVDCSPESPKGRRSLCYDRAAWQARKEYKPKDTAMDVADAMGVEILSEEEYRALQKLGEFDTATSSWLNTPGSIRKLGGAIFADRRYDTVFVFHNGADSYYASRGFRAVLKV